MTTSELKLMINEIRKAVRKEFKAIREDMEMESIIKEVHFEKEETTNTPKWIDINEVAKITGYAVATLYCKVQEGKIAHSRVGQKGRLLFDYKDVIDFVNSNRIPVK